MHQIYLNLLFTWHFMEHYWANLVDNQCNLFSKLQQSEVTIPGCSLLYHPLHADAWHPCMKEEDADSVFCLVGFFNIAYSLSGEVIRANYLILPQKQRNFGNGSNSPLSWLPPSWLHIVFKWNIRHILQLFFCCCSSWQSSSKFTEKQAEWKRDF